MPDYFFDSSALVKRYHIELGTPTVLQVIDATANAIRISRLTVVELISAFAIQVRTQVISRDDATLFQRMLRDDIASGRFEVFPVSEIEFSLAEGLLERHAVDFRLRALDAFQLSGCDRAQGARPRRSFCCGRPSALRCCGPRGISTGQSGGCVRRFRSA